MDEFDRPTKDRVLANQANWDARAPLHAASGFYRRPAEGWFAGYEWEDLGDLAGSDVLHLQCHLGTETLAFARAGARTAGLDLSGRSIDEARRISAAAGLEIDYVQADVYDAADAFGGRQFDVVYTGKGALCYLPDLPKWVSAVNALLRPGGRLYVVEFHPLLNSLGPMPPPDGSQALVLHDDYLAGRGAIERDSSITYTGDRVAGATTSFEWMHGLGEVVSAVVDGGLRIDRLRESDTLPWPRWQSMSEVEPGWWRLPADHPRLALFYALLATKP